MERRLADPVREPRTDEGDVADARLELGRAFQLLFVVVHTRAGGRRQDRHSALVLGEELVDVMAVELVQLGEQSINSLVGRKVQHGCHITELDVGIDNDHRHAGLASQAQAQVDADHALADAALAAGHGDHRAPPLETRKLAGPAHLAALLLGQHSIYRF